MPEYVRVDDVEQGIRIMGSYSRFKTKRILGRIMVMRHSLPFVDAVEVVRCKDCDEAIMHPEKQTLCVCNKTKVLCNINHFCSYGKRKEGETV